MTDTTQYTYLEEHNPHRHQCVTGVVLILSYSDLECEAIGVGSSAVRLVRVIVLPNAEGRDGLHVSPI